VMATHGQLQEKLNFMENQPVAPNIGVLHGLTAIMSSHGN
jgi:hypothetical protein